MAKNPTQSKNKVLYPPGLTFEYLPQNTFLDRADVFRRAQEALVLGNVSQEALDLGKKYRSLIESAYEPKASVRWIHEKVGYGVFAEEKIPQNAFVGEYTGVVRENVRLYFQPMNNYCYEYPLLDDIGRNFVIDATKGNFTRFINHSYRPNLKPVYAFCDGFYHLIFISLKEIEKEEQLCYEYGGRYWLIRSPPEDL